MYLVCDGLFNEKFLCEEAHVLHQPHLYLYSKDEPEIKQNVEEILQSYTSSRLLKDARLIEDFKNTYRLCNLLLRLLCGH